MGKKILLVRVCRDVSFEGLAKKMRVSKDAVIHWELQDHICDTIFSKLCTALDVPENTVRNLNEGQYC